MKSSGDVVAFLQLWHYLQIVDCHTLFQLLYTTSTALLQQIEILPSLHVHLLCPHSTVPCVYNNFVLHFFNLFVSD